MKKKCVFCNAELNDAEVYCQACAANMDRQRLYEAFHKYVSKYYLDALENAFERENSSDGELYWHLIRFIRKMLTEDDESFFNDIVEWVKEKNTFSKYFSDEADDVKSLEYIVKMPEFRELFVTIG